MPNPLMPLLICAVVLGAAEALTPQHDLFAAALAQSDDDDDDGGGDDNDDDAVGPSASPAGGGEDDDGPAPRPTRPRPADLSARPAAPVALPTEAEREIIALGLSETQLSLAVAQGFSVIETRAIDSLQVQSARLAAPDGLSLAEARTALAAIAPQSAADVNHFYRAEEAAQPCQGGHCAAFEQIAWIPAVAADGLTCLFPRGADALVTLPTPQRSGIGMLDTGIKADHAALAAADVDLVKLAPDNLTGSRERHGTAVASILVGAPDRRSPGLVPEARLVAVDVFHRAGADQRSDAFTLIAGLDALAKRRVAVINLSLAGRRMPLWQK